MCKPLHWRCSSERDSEDMLVNLMVKIFVSGRVVLEVGRVVPGLVVLEAPQRKCVKYEAKCADIGYGFLPSSFSSFGELEKDAVTLLKRIRKFSMAQGHFLDRKFPLYMMASIDEVVEKSSLADQDDVGSGVIKAESTVIQVEAKRLIQFDLIVMFFNVYSQTTEERSARYASTSFSEMAMYLDSEAPLSSLLSLQLDSFLYGSFSNFRENDAELML
ncbi:hypothetical protein Tco_1086205 [Tanacetum coccineum]